MVYEMYSEMWPGVIDCIDMSKKWMNMDNNLIENEWTMYAYIKEISNMENNEKFIKRKNWKIIKNIVFLFQIKKNSDLTYKSE